MKSAELCGDTRKKIHDDALLDEKLNPSQELSDLPPTREKILHLLRGKPSEYLKPDTVEKLCAFIKEKPEFFDRIEAESVLCHGDFGYGNIMLCGGKIYFIDFEFAYAGSRYSDIGRFFRRKAATWLLPTGGSAMLLRGAIVPSPRCRPTGLCWRICAM